GHDLARDREPQTQPVGAAGHKGGEELRHEGSRYAGAVVAHIDAHGICSMYADRKTGGGRFVQRLGRILEQVDENLLEAHTVGVDLGVGVVERDVDYDPLAAQPVANE